ncbi:hypothetical protein LQZ19_05990 [Treponema primitia]|uniref:PG0541 family transporter-associated protein n=1 Tax=Treponema primitia TaxID=88058 RepID=UPI003980F215
MKRLEVMANRSVQEEIITGLEEAMPDFYYTFIPVVHGRGRTQYRMGTPTWPEENFMLISYLHDEDAQRAREIITEVKHRFPEEGIKVFFVDGEHTANT